MSLIPFIVTAGREALGPGREVLGLTHLQHQGHSKVVVPAHVAVNEPEPGIVGIKPIEYRYQIER